MARRWPDSCEFGYGFLARHAFGFHSFEPGVEVVEDAAGFGMKNSPNENVGHRTDVLRILANEFADAELPAVPGFGKLADPGGPAREVRYPLAELLAGSVARAQAFDNRIGGELTALQCEPHTG